MRLIDADDIAPKLEGKYNQDMVRYAPTIDAVPVVRCRDCRYISVPTERGNFLCGRKMLGLVRPDDFCSFGERMEGE